MILITGGAGYIGSHMVKYLQQREEPVLVFDNFSTGHLPALRGAPSVRGDLRQPQDLDAIFQSYPIQCVMHFASKISAGESMHKPAEYYEVNTLGSLQLLAAMSRHHIQLLIVSSTAAVYGEPETVPIPEEHRLKPTNPYGESKLAVERALTWHETAYGLRFVALRYFNAAGADPEGELGEDHHPEEHLIPLTLFAAMGKRESLSLFGTDYPTPDGTAIRDYVHVWDLCQAHYLALQQLRAGAPSAVYNLGNGRGYSVREVLQTAEAVVGKPIPHSVAPRRPGDASQLVASWDKAHRLLGWQPEYPDLSSMIAHAWHWFQRYPYGYEK